MLINLNKFNQTEMNVLDSREYTQFVFHTVIGSDAL